jgi:hypothetical protein
MSGHIPQPPAGGGPGAPHEAPNDDYGEEAMDDDGGIAGLE